MKTRTKIIGLGNEILTDDGIGTRIVHDLKKFFKNQGIDYYTTPEGSLDLLEEIKGYDKLIVIDAIISGDKNPGDVCIMSYPLKEPTLHLSGLHDVDFNDMIRLSHELDLKMPESISVISIEIVEDKTFSKELSEKLQRKYLFLIDFIKKYIHDFAAEACKEKTIEEVENENI